MKVAIGTMEFTVEELELIGGGKRASREDVKEWAPAVLKAELEALAENSGEEGGGSERDVYTETELQEMDLDELQGICNEENIEPKKADKKKSVIKAILEWQESLNDDDDDDDDGDDGDEEEVKPAKKSKKGKKNKS